MRRDVPASVDLMSGAGESDLKVIVEHFHFTGVFTIGIRLPGP